MSAKVKMTVNYNKSRTAPMLATLALKMAWGDKVIAKKLIKLMYGPESRNTGSIAFCDESCKVIDEAEITFKH